MTSPVPQPSLHRLASGVRVALDPMPALATAAVGVWVRVGTRWERPEENGVAHLFEHMAFKGAAGRDARAFAEAVESLGASMNAATSHERTAYYARTLAEHAPAMLDLIADVILAPRWAPDELAKEKGVVLQEIGEAADQPDDRVFELHQAALFPDQPLGRPILGRAETLAGIEVATLEAFRNAHLTSDRVVVAVAGAFDADAVLATAERRFGALPPGQRAATPPAAPAAAVVEEARKLEQVHLAITWPGAPAGDDAIYAVRLLAEIFGGGMSSRLFQEVREERGLVYTIDAYIDGYEDVGRLGVYAGCAARNAREVAELVDAALRALARDGPTAAELARAKTGLEAQLLMGAEAPLARAEARAAQTFLRDRLIPFGEIAAKVRAVDIDRVQAAAAAALAGPVTAAALGPKTGLGAVRRFAAG